MQYCRQKNDNKIISYKIWWYIIYTIYIQYNIINIFACDYPKMLTMQCGLKNQDKTKTTIDLELLRRILKNFGLLILLEQRAGMIQGLKTYLKVHNSSW